MKGTETVAASAPGKLILMGEHAVVYGEPALVAAVDLRARARLESVPGSDVEIRLPDLEHRERLSRQEVKAYADRARDRWERFAAAPDARSFGEVRGEDPAHLVKVALGEAMEEAGGGSGQGTRLEVESEIPIGRGFGSSAAVAVAVIAAFLARRDGGADPATVERLALEAERRQHGLPSGVDSATALHGGLVWAEPRSGGRGLRTEPLEADPGGLSPFQVYDTGPPAQETGEVVAAVRERVEREPDRYRPVLSRMGEAVRGLRDALAGGEAGGRAGELVRRYEADLERLGVVPDPVRRVVRQVEAGGDAAKISGAGALESETDGGAGVLLVHRRPPGREAPECLRGLRRFGVRLGAPGFRVERGE